MGRDVIEMLRGGDLGGGLSGQVKTGFLHQFDEPVQLARNEKRVDRITEHDEFGLIDGLQGGGEVLLQRLDPLPGIQITEPVSGILLFQEEAGVQGDGVLSLGAAVDDENIHGRLSIGFSL